jgi:serine/threonine-protein kinase HipA
VPEENSSSIDYQPRDELYLWWLANPSAPQLIGDLKLVNRGHGVALTYAPAWLRSGFALSEDLPLQAPPFQPSRSDTAVGAVDDARPDRWGERVIRVLDKPKRLSLMEYLYFAGDDRFGALGVSLSHDAYVARPASALPLLCDVSRVHDIVKKLAEGGSVNEPERRLVNPGRSMGGAKPKSLVNIDGAPWVLKFADDYDHDWPLIEHATMRLGAKAGVHMCDTQSVPFAPRKSAIAIRRFDRTPEGMRLHCTSAAMVLRAAGEADGYPEFASVMRRLLKAELHAAARVELFRRMVFNILCDNTDDHERNHAFVLMDGGYALSPAFDVVPSMQNLNYQAMRVGKDQMDSTLDNAMSECAAFGLKKNTAAALIRSVCDVVSGWREFMAAQGVSAVDIDALEPFIDGDKALMRRDFQAHKRR